MAYCTHSSVVRAGCMSGDDGPEQDVEPSFQAASRGSPDAVSTEPI